MEDAYPLTWPAGKPREGRPATARFETTLAIARDCLINEVKLLGGSLPVISSNVRLKRDGFPYAGDKEPDDRGVAVYFALRGKQMCFACDRWDKVKDNIQAIRHTIGALRGIERWGTGDMVQAAFTGFIALPAPPNPYDVLGVTRDATTEEIDRAYKHKVVQHHPDNGGSVDEFHRITEARRRLKGGE